MRFTKAQAYGNDFLLVDESEVAGRDIAGLARELCERHTGIGADGLIAYRLTTAGATMRLANADGSHAEVSGNGVRCLAAVVLDARSSCAGGAIAGDGPITVETDAGPKVLQPLGAEHGGFVFRASMGSPTELRVLGLDVAGERVRVAALRVGNPQCVVIGSPLTDERLRRLGPALERHREFPGGTNVELAEVVAPGTIRILIWERGVGPTLASGTGACAAAIAAAALAGAARDVEVASPGGIQRVEWLEDGLYLTGWAGLVARGEWIG